MTSIAKPVTYGAAFTLLCAWAVSRIAGDSFLQMHWGGFEMHFDDRIWPGENGASAGASDIDIGIDGKTLDFLRPRIRTARESSA